jgi:hypothetical protein
MGDLTIAQDLLDGVADALADLGATRKVRVIARGALTPGDPGAGGAQSATDFDVEAVIVGYDERYVDGTAIRAGDRQAILSIGPLSAAQVAGLKPGARLVDGAHVYSAVNANVPEAAGTPVVAILQLRGSNG